MSAESSGASDTIATPSDSAVVESRTTTLALEQAAAPKGNRLGLRNPYRLPQNLLILQLQCAPQFAKSAECLR